MIPYPSLNQEMTDSKYSFSGKKEMIQPDEYIQSGFTYRSLFMHKNTKYFSKFQKSQWEKQLLLTGDIAYWIRTPQDPSSQLGGYVLQYTF